MNNQQKYITAQCAFLTTVLFEQARKPNCNRVNIHRDKFPLHPKTIKKHRDNLVDAGIIDLGDKYLPQALAKGDNGFAMQYALVEEKIPEHYWGNFFRDFLPFMEKRYAKIYAKFGKPIPEISESLKSVTIDLERALEEADKVHNYEKYARKTFTLAFENNLPVLTNLYTGEKETWLPKNAPTFFWKGGRTSNIKGSYFYSIAKLAERNDNIFVYKGKNGNKIYISDFTAEDYAAQMVRETRSNVKAEIARIAIGEFYEYISDTNGREIHNITNLPKKIIKHIRMDGERLKSIDLKNSQLTIFANIILNKNNKLGTFNQQLQTPNTLSVFTPFITLCQTGKIYEEIAALLGHNDRQKGKIATFEILFDRIKQSMTQEAFRKAFPEAMAVVDEYKKRNRYNQFAILLQRAESLIFSDVRARLREYGVKCIGKHDSVLVKESQVEFAERIVRMVLSEYFDGFELKIEDA